MKVGKRFLIWGLVGIFLTAGLSSFAGGLRAGHAALSASAVGPAAIAQTSNPQPNSADDLQLPETEPEADEAESADEPDTLNLPDFEPKLPAETSPEDITTDEDDTWQDGDIETSGDASEPPKITKRQQILITADEHYLAGDYETAEILYRQVKNATWQVDPTNLRPAPIFEPADLPPAAAVYWREAQAGYEKGLAHRTEVPLELLTSEYPEFIPAQVFYANYLIEQDDAATADALLDHALMVYPSEPALLQARTSTQMALANWIEASITARQFTLLNPEHPEAEAMASLSEANLGRFRAEMNEEIRGNFIGNLVTGAAGVVLTGGLIGPYTAINSAILLLQGESAVGANAADQIKDQAPMMSDRPVDEYVDTIGQKLATLAGRDEFEYRFHVIDDPELNAFALPGGKIFINSGAILKTHSEAELAGLLAHELAHAVLSHGFQLVTNGNLINSVAGIIPIGNVGGIAASLAFSEYSRQMERQADVLGTQILATAGYAADGLHSLMITLEAETGDRGGIQWFSSHPAPTERVDYLKQIVEVGGYNRYAYEGVAPHLIIQQRVTSLMDTASTEDADQDAIDESPENEQ